MMLPQQELTDSLSRGPHSLEIIHKISHWEYRFFLYAHCAHIDDALTLNTKMDRSSLYC